MFLKKKYISRDINLDDPVQPQNDLNQQIVGTYRNFYFIPNYGVTLTVNWSLTLLGKTLVVARVLTLSVARVAALLI